MLFDCGRWCLCRWWQHATHSIFTIFNFLSLWCHWNAKQNFDSPKNRLKKLFSSGALSCQPKRIHKQRANNNLSPFCSSAMDIIMPCSKRLSADLSSVNGSDCPNPIPAVQFSKCEIQNFLTVSETYFCFSSLFSIFIPVSCNRIKKSRLFVNYWISHCLPKSSSGTFQTDIAFKFARNDRNYFHENWITLMASSRSQQVDHFPRLGNLKSFL